ncbi:MAG: hypothetical protein JOY58_17055 [Solirubrobacterales bacterium]|nr:hypothetical protein [Solirubrobacterales bacterium]
MAVGLMITFNGGSEEQYRAVHSHMRVDENPPSGLIFHSAGPVDGGWRVIDFWESREAFDRFLESGFAPAAQELGDRAFTTPPDIAEFPVHNITKP